MNATAPTSKIALVTGASSGFGALTVRALADAGHTVYAGMRNTADRNAQAAADAERHGTDSPGHITTVEMEVTDQDAVDKAVARVISEQDRIDVVVHNAGHMVFGPTEAFTPEQLAAVYDVNVLSTQRVNRAVLPHLRAQRDGLVVWIGSSSSRGGTPPYLAPYFAAKAAMDSLAVSYAAELARFGVETSIVLPGAYTQGTNHFAHAGQPEDTTIGAAYDELYPGLMDQVGVGLAALAGDAQDPTAVSDAVATLVDTPKGQRPFRVHIDPARPDDGAAIVNAVGDRVRAELYRNIGIDDLLTVTL